MLNDLAVAWPNFHALYSVEINKFIATTAQYRNKIEQGASVPKYLFEGSVR